MPGHWPERTITIYITMPKLREIVCFRGCVLQNQHSLLPRFMLHEHDDKQALAASQEDREKGKNEGISAARGLQAYWSCQLGEPVLDIFVAKFSRALGPGCVDIVVVGERTLFTLREQGTVRLQKILGYQPACACKYAVVAAPGEEGARLTGTTVREIDPGFAAVVEEENIIIAADTDQLMVYKVRERRTGVAV